MLKVYMYGHPVLRKVSEDITPDYEGLKELVAQMYDTMYATEGIGLAAPQIGRNDRIIVIDASPLAEDFPECDGAKMTLINPRLEVLDGPEVSRSEGCLSLPGLSENVSRVEHVRLSWVDEDFQPREQEFSGFLARVIQHEYDHLEGKVYTDRISPIRRQLISGKLRNIASGKTRASYPAVYATPQRGRR